MVVALAAGTASASSELRVVGRHFEDAGGRVVLLRGVNVAGDAKVPPFRPALPAVFEPLPGFGFNVVRLLFTWEAYEPEMGMPDASYLDYYEAAARAAWARGLYVIVDFHQDAFSRWSIGGCGEGFPRWAVPAGLAAAAPDNGPACADWGTRMLTDDKMKQSWDAFYAGQGGVRERYLAMVAAVAARLQAVPGVVGYDLLNEPWGDEVSQLGPLHAAAVAALRARDASAIILVSPQALTSAGSQTKLPRPGFDNFAYAPHWYDGAVLLAKKWGGASPARAFAVMTAKANEWGVPLLLGEFGAPAGTERGAEFVAALYDELDSALASGTHWVYTPGWTAERKDGWNAEDLSIVDGSGALRDNFRPRAVAQRVSGAPLAFRGGTEVELSWQHEPARGRTELFVPAGDWVIEAEGAACVFETTTRVVCESAAGGEKRLLLRARGGGGGDSCGLTGAEALLLVGLAALLRRRHSQATR